MQPILEVSNLSVGVQKKGNLVPILTDISFSVNNSSTLGIVGESGCGKSMTSLAIMRLLPYQVRITSGAVYLNGSNLIEYNEEELSKVRGSQISMIFQDPMTSLNPALTVGEQMVESLVVHKNISRSEAQERAIELLNLVGIPAAKNRFNEYPHQLSGGMRQRVMIAIAIACEPKVVIADEPTTALDVTIQAQIINLLDHLRTEFGTSIILITHDVGLIAGFTEQVIVMYAGMVVEKAEVEELFYNPQHPYTKGLLGSLPNPLRLGQELLSIPGIVPSPEHFPSGCRFHSRCKYAMENCAKIIPPWFQITPKHQVACWLLGKEL
ncbi:MAG: ABC transporter ATP-binding protein [Bacteroidota bacterium]